MLTIDDDEGITGVHKVLSDRHAQSTDSVRWGTQVGGLLFYTYLYKSNLTAGGNCCSYILQFPLD